MIKTILTTIAILIRMPFTNRIGIGSFLEKFEEARIYVYFRATFLFVNNLQFQSCLF